MTLDELFGEYYRLERRMDATSTKEHRQARSKRRQQKQSEIMAHPESFDNVRCWMIDITGKITDLYEGKPRKIARQYLREAAANCSNAMEQTVRTLLDENGFKIDGSGMDTGQWSLGAHCTEPESRRLCYLLYNRFATDISHGLLRVERRLWDLEMTPE